MTNLRMSIVAFCCCLLAVSTTQQDECPPVETVANFDLEQYTSAPWYVHQQAVNAYSPLDRNYCVRADYEIRPSPTSLWGYTVDVRNQARDKNGEETIAQLCAIQSEDSASKLAVAPCFLPQEAAGPYWVVLYDEAEGYALISGGPPTKPGVNGCRTGDGVNDSGLWIFSRSPVRNESLIDEVRAMAETLGFDVSVLNDVDQKNCGWDDEVDASCKDSAGDVVSFWFGTQTCDWVAEYAYYRCWFFGDQCPESCGKCN